MLAALELDEIAAYVFIDIAVIMVVARLMGALFKRFHQPAVVGEILAGILLGPTLLGRLPGNPTEHLFPPDVRPFLNVLAQLGLIIFMFIVGLELDMKLIRGKERLAAVISLSSIVLPFGLGVLLAAVLHDNHDGVAGAEDFLPFALFIGASMSVTAFPVLARILAERGMYRTTIGSLALACAAVDDVLAWSMLALVVAVIEATGIWELPRIMVASAAFVAFSFVVVRPQLERLAAHHRRTGRLSANALSVVLIGVLVSSFITSQIGIHAIFGAFLFGVIMPRQETHELFREILERLEQVTVLVLLPVFFIATGFGVDVAGLSGDNVGELGLILLAACVGKFLGAAAAARVQGLVVRRAAAIGILMNTRGLTELVILNIGVSKGVLDGELFTMLVVMAVFTTVITSPLLRRVYPDALLAADIAEGERAALGPPSAYRVLVVLGDPDEGEALLDVAIDLVGDEDPAEIVLSRFMPHPTDAVEVGGGLVDEVGELSASLRITNALARIAEQRGARTVVLSQLSDDIAGDVTAQATTVEADVIVVGRGPRTGDDPAVGQAVLAGAPQQVVLVAGPVPLHRDGALLVPVAEGVNGDAALTVALRLGHARFASVHLVEGTGDGRPPGRRAGVVAEAFGRAGVESAVNEDVRGPLGLVVVAVDGAIDGSPDEPTLYVRGALDHERDGLLELVDRVALRRHRGGYTRTGG